MNSEKKGNASIDGKFALWGPPGSGKDWTIRSFARSLEQYNKENGGRRFDKDFEHMLLHEDGRTPVTIQAPEQNINPTETGKPEDTVFIYERKGRSNSKMHIVSSHRHEILITNASGEDLMNGDVHSVNYGVQRASCVLILLDNTQIETGRLTQAQYQAKVAGFLSSLDNPPPGKKRYIAICITKIDLLKTKRWDPAEDLVMYFGPGMEEVFRVYRKATNVEYKPFSISSYGFLKDGKTPNFDYDQQHLKDFYGWNPINVEQPFFWLFEKVERERLSRFSNGLSAFLFEDERKNAYREYPKGH